MHIYNQARNKYTFIMDTKPFSKHEKYQDTNPISKYLVAGFFHAISDLYSKIEVDVIIDAGCGEGMVLKSLEDRVKSKKCYAIDLDPKEVDDAKRNIPFCNVRIGSIYEAPFEDNFADLVICSEVLEHLAHPEKALDELHRITNTYAILSVPKEPLWRIMNVARCKYLASFGNTPDHRNHWSMRAFKKFVSPRFSIIDTKNPPPWNVVLCKKKPIPTDSY